MGCDTNLLNAYLWRNEYNIKFAFYDDTIVKVYCNPDESVWGYCMPTGKNIKGALEEVFKDAEERNGNLQIVMLTNGNRAMLETMFPDKFDYVRSPENQDYIYTSRDPATLAAKGGSCILISSDITSFSSPVAAKRELPKAPHGHGPQGPAN